MLRAVPIGPDGRRRSILEQPPMEKRHGKVMEIQGHWTESLDGTMSNKKDFTRFSPRICKLRNIELLSLVKGVVIAPGKVG